MHMNMHCFSGVNVYPLSVLFFYYGYVHRFIFADICEYTHFISFLKLF